MNLNIDNAHKTQAGFTYVETLLAVLLLAVCLTPMLRSLTSMVAQETSMAEMRKNSSCVKEAMEKTLSDSYSNLLSNAKSTYSSGVFSMPIMSYSLAPTTDCRYQRNVYILYYAPNSANPFPLSDNDILYVRIEQTGTPAKATLVIRP